MSITAIASNTLAPSSLNGSKVTGTVTKTTKTLGQQDFLTLLAKQFETQDPMQPMDDTAFIAQMAQFTSLQQMSTMSQSQLMMTGNSYLGRNVTVQNPDGTTDTGLVTAVDNTGTAPALVINGTSYPLTEVKVVQMSTTGATVPPATTPTTTPPATTPTSTGSTDLLTQLTNLISNRVTQGISTSTAAASTPAA